jgi:hypothetical protein
MFRDESQGLSEKHRRLKETRVQVKPERTYAIDVESTAVPDISLALMASPQPAQFQPVSPFSLSLGTSAEDQATCFFFQNYILGGKDVFKGHVDYLSEIYSTEEVGSGLADSVASLGMVGLANFWKAPNIMSNAVIKYNSAMRTISSQLRDAEQAKADQTLIAILLMGLYEVLLICLLARANLLT